MDCDKVLAISDGQQKKKKNCFLSDLKSICLIFVFHVTFPPRKRYRIMGIFLAGKLMEFDEPSKLMRDEGSLFGKLVKEYWSRSSNNGGDF